MFLNPVQQPALGLRFPSAEAPQTSYTHCPSFILCILLRHQMPTVDLQESHVPLQNRCWLKPLCTIGEFTAAAHYKKSKGNKPMTLQACYADSGLHHTLCKAGCLQPKHDFLVYLSPNSHADLRDSNNLVWGKQNQVSCVSKQCRSPKQLLPKQRRCSI